MSFLKPSYSITTDIYVSFLTQLILKMRRFGWTLSTIPSKDCFEWIDLGEDYELEKKWDGCSFIISSRYELIYRKDKIDKNKYGSYGSWILRWIEKIPVKSVRTLFTSTLEMYKEEPPTIDYFFRVCNRSFFEWEIDFEDVFQNVIFIEQK